MVGIGASAGGLEAFGQLLGAIKPDSGMAFVLVQHLDPQRESLLTDILATLTSMPVITVQDGVHIQADRVYVIPPNVSMVITDSVLKLVKREPGLHLPIDIFFRSLASVQGSRAIGVVLSGNASDGSMGLRAIKAECGLTFAQDESSARFGGMPHNAIATGAVDYILSPADIGRELGELGNHPYLLPGRVGDPNSETLPEGNGELKWLFALLNTATSVDFSHYKPTTVRRRIGRRMMVLRLETLREYARYSEQHPEELQELYRDLLISVTSFFRDPEAFQSLTALLSGMLSKDLQRRDAMRVWVPGCATAKSFIPWPFACTSFSRKRSSLFPSSFLAPISARLPWNEPARASTQKLLQRVCRRSGYSASSTKLTAVARLSNIFARTASLRVMM